MRHVFILLPILAWVQCGFVFGQGTSKPPLIPATDTASWYVLQFQQTAITQYHPEFKAPYSGFRSLQPKAEAATSLTSTLFLTLKFGKGFSLIANPELAGGSGLSSAQGAAGFPNGETFRIGNPSPQVYIARLLLDIERPIKSKGVFRFHAGKFSLADYFDRNAASHDPRTSFMNWALMSNGAWDYPANTRGFTYGVAAEAEYKDWVVRGGVTLVPRYANGSVMDFDIRHNRGHVLEFERHWGDSADGGSRTHPGAVRMLLYYNLAHMGSYRQTVQTAKDQLLDTLDITTTRQDGQAKMGIGISFDQALSSSLTVFARAGFNDGRNETWAFTEIDRTLSVGGVWKGDLWHRPTDKLGLAFVGNGLSRPHRYYLANGGVGFIIGDGRLHYAPELISEVYYSFDLRRQHVFLSPHYQFIKNPAYNRDRGPAHIVGLRVHTEF